ncbi:hypothetical protein LINGRAHAP2_LOCUS20571 [Linum grandiflorum]
MTEMSFEFLPASFDAEPTLATPADDERRASLTSSSPPRPRPIESRSCSRQRFCRRSRQNRTPSIYRLNP